MTPNDKIISASVDTFLEKQKYEFTVQLTDPITHYKDREPIYKKQSWWERLLRKRKEIIPQEPEVASVEHERTFTIYPCKAANMARIAGMSLKLPSQLNGGSQAEVYLPLINDHLEDVIYTVAAGIQNNKHEPDTALIDFIRDNFDNIDLYGAIYYILENVNMESFFNSIVLIKGTISIVKKETSPVDGSE